jgi:Hemerythrin HHE cation binding domain.
MIISGLLTDDHDRLNEMFAGIFADFDAEDVEAVYRNLDFFWALLAVHIRAEHLRLFPQILQAAELSDKTNSEGVPGIEYVRETIARLHSDHNYFMRELLSAIKQMRLLRGKGRTMNDGELLAKARRNVEAVQKRLETHNEIEEKEVYLWADLFFEGASGADLREKIQKELDNIPPRFAPEKDQEERP